MQRRNEIARHNVLHSMFGVNMILGNACAVSQHGGGSDAKKLASASPAVMEKLSAIINNSELPQGKNSSGLKLDSIEIHLGIEARFTIGFSAKTNADVTLTFKRASS